MNEIEILRSYQNCDAVKTILHILNTPAKREQLDEAKEDWLSEKLIQFTHSAMDEAGIKADENGQYDFSDFVFFDMQMPDKDKIYWLELANNDSQKERIDALKHSMSNEATNL